jgi:hypothetical protein
MPVVNREKERRIVIEGRKQGKSDEFIKAAVLRFRERESAKQAKKPSTLAKVGGVISGIGQKLSSQFSRAGEAIGKAKDVGIKGLARGAYEKGTELTQGGLFPTMGRLGAPLADRTKEFAKAANTAHMDLPRVKSAAFSAARQVLRGDDMSAPFEGPDLSGVQERNIQRRSAVEGAADFVPNPAVQFAAGLSGGQRRAMEEGMSAEEATGSGLVSGTQRYALMKMLDKLYKGKQAKSEAAAQRFQKKLTVKEQKMAIKQGRAERPKQSWLNKKLFGQKADVVKAGSQEKAIRDTVKRQIGRSADKMDDIQLNNAMEKKSLELRTKLKPELKKVNVSRKATNSLKNQWKSVQAENAESLKSIGVAESPVNSKFAKAIAKIGKAKNLSEVDDLAVAYDKSISSTIKDANFMSSDTLKLQKEAWLNNRSLLRNFIKNNSGAAKEAYSEMHNLLTGAENIASKGLQLKDAPGVLSAGFTTKAGLKAGAAAGTTILGGLGLWNWGRR